MSYDQVLKYGYVNVIDKKTHGGRLTRDAAERFTNGFTRTAVLRNLANIDEGLSQRAFYDAVPADKTLQYRLKEGEQPVSVRNAQGQSDYNFVSGKVASGAEFLDDIFERKLGVYSHLGTVASGFDDPYEWGKLAFLKVKEAIFSKPWWGVAPWRITGHFFMGNATADYAEPAVNGGIGTDWHMFPTLNVFVMIAGKKKWFIRPPQIGDQFRDYDTLFATSSGREAAGADFESDIVYMEPGDVIINPPYQWHKVLNAEGLTIGGAFRVLDLDYLEQLGTRRGLDISKVSNPQPGDRKEELAHLLTSLAYASRDLCRAQMMLNDLEYVFLRQKHSPEFNVGHN